MNLKEIGTTIWKHKFLAALAVVAALIIFSIVRNNIQSNKPKETAQVTNGNIEETVTAEGTADAKEKADLYFAAPAKVAWMGVKEGDVVKKWQAVASLDKRSLELTRQTALMDYMDARATFDQMQEKYGVDARNLDNVSLSKDDRRTLDKTQRDLNRSVNVVDQSTLGMENSVLVSPISGTVVDDGGIIAGDNMTTSEIAMKSIRIVNPNSAYFSALIDEVDYGKIKVGQKANITLDAFPGKSWEGTITYINPEATKTDSGSVKVKTEIKVEDVKDFIPNLNGEANITVNQKDNVLLIPKKYISYKNGKTTVLIMKDNKITEQEIKVGMTNSLEAEVTEGLSEGQTVVLK